MISFFFLSDLIVILLIVNFFYFRKFFKLMFFFYFIFQHWNGEELSFLIESGFRILWIVNLRY
jgi:hypothetical protein